MNVIVNTMPDVGWQRKLFDVAEKTVNTYWQAFLGLLVASPFFESPSTGVLVAAAVAAVPAGLTAIIAFVQGTADPLGWPPIVQTLFRAVRTFLVTVLGLVAAAPWVLGELDFRVMWATAFAAGVSAVLALIKGEAVAVLSKSGSPSLLPVKYDLAVMQHAHVEAIEQQQAA